jgi:hypothetical protein
MRVTIRRIKIEGFKRSILSEDIGRCRVDRHGELTVRLRAEGQTAGTAQRLEEPAQLGKAQFCPHRLQKLAPRFGGIDDAANSHLEPSHITDLRAAPRDETRQKRRERSKEMRLFRRICG